MSAVPSGHSLLSDGEPFDLSLHRARKGYRDLEEWVMSDQAAHLAEHEVEARIERESREINRLLLQAHINRRGTGDVGPAIVVHRADGSTQTYQQDRVHRCNVTSIFGDVRAKRMAYRAKGRASIHPQDQALQLPARSFSYQVQRRAVAESVRGPFDEVVESIQKQTGLTLSKLSCEQMAAAAAEDFDAFYQQRVRRAPKQTGPILVASADCKGVPMVKPQGAEKNVRRNKGQKKNKKKMATVATVFTTQPRVRSPEQVVASLFEDGPHESDKASVRCEEKRVWASLQKSKDEVIAEVADEVSRRDRKGDKQRVAVVDGERALQMRVGKFLPSILLILDFLHVLEKLWKAAYVFAPEGSDEAKGWVRKRALMILQGKVSQVVKGLRLSVTRRKLSATKVKAVESVAGYLYRNRMRMRYHEYLAAG
jgi:hypothetical protein